MANAYANLGRHDDAVAALRQVVDRVGEVSQTLNLAEMELDFGRPQDALTVLATFDAAQEDKTSPYGLMVLHLVRACAHARLGRNAEARADAAYVVAHAEDSRPKVVSVLLCTGDMAGAAREVVALLNDPDQRIDQLSELSEFRHPRPGAPISPNDAALRLVRARPEVEAAIARAGGTGRFPLIDAEL